MKLLLDTHALLWMLGNNPRLGPAARGLVSDPAHDVFVSAVSCWEITVKARLGKLTVSVPQVLGAVAAAGLEWLDVRPSHLLALARLPVHADHRDPFDHLLIAQAVAEDLTFLSADRNALRYPVRHLPP